MNNELEKQAEEIGVSIEGYSRGNAFRGAYKALQLQQAEIEKLEARVEELEKLIKSASDYLDTNELTSIGSTSILHKQFKQALTNKE